MGQKKQESVKAKEWTVPFKQIILISNSQKITIETQSWQMEV